MAHCTALRRLVALAAPVAVATLLNTSTGQASDPQASLELCRANVAPCQHEVSIPQNGTIKLDLVLNTAPASAVETGSGEVVAWETHLQLADTSVVHLIPGSPSGQPILEQGEADLVLDDFVPLPAGTAPGNGQYFSVQNRFAQASGTLDYAVTLARFGPSKSQPHVLPIATGPRRHLGRIAVRGSAQGVSAISMVHGPETNPSQVVTFNSSGQLHAVDLQSSPGTTAEINVGVVPTPELTGQVGQGPPGTGAPAIPFPAELTISFWKLGAVPEWRGGNDLPLATFRRVTTDPRGAFRVPDIAPSLLSPGVYDLRIKGRRTLASIVPAVTVPGPSAAGGPPAISPVTLGALQEGDIDGNNIINEADLLEFETSFGLLETQAGFVGNADFNRDAVVDVLDFSRLARNFGKRGD